MSEITPERYNQIEKIQKLQGLDYNEGLIIYTNIENAQSLSEISKAQLDGELSLKVGQLAIITKNLFDHFLKVYQIANISLLNDENILVDVEDGLTKWQVSFVNLHESKTVSYEENYNNLLRVVQQFFLQHKQSLLNYLNDENRNELRTKIEWVTIALNDILNILKSRRHHLDIILFVKRNVVEETYQHNIFIDEQQLPHQPQPIVQQVAQPAFKQVALQPPPLKIVPPPKEQTKVYQEQTFTKSDYSSSKAIDPNLWGFYEQGLTQLEIQNSDLKEQLMKYCTTKGKSYNQKQAQNILENIYVFLVTLDEYIDDQMATQEVETDLTVQTEQLKVKYRKQWEVVLKQKLGSGNTDFLDQSQEKVKQFAEQQMRALIKDITYEINQIAQEQNQF